MTALSAPLIQNPRFGRDYTSLRESVIPNAIDMELPTLLEQRLRQQLARELHDGPVQLVSNAAMNLMVVERHMEREPAHAHAELVNTVATLQRAIQEMRSMLFELRPMVLESEGLIAAIRQLATHLRQTTSLEVELDLQVGYLDLAPGDETNIYYIVQEAIQNIHKHARAKRVQIRMNVFEESLHVTIRDDGSGFDLERIRGEYEKRKSLGLINLYERAQLIRGHLTIDALQGRGTTIRLTIPLSHHSA